MKIVTRQIGVRNLPKYLQEAVEWGWTVVAVIPAEYYTHAGVPGNPQMLMQVLVVIQHPSSEAEEPIG